MYLDIYIYILHDLLPCDLLPCKYLFTKTTSFFFKVNYMIKLGKSNDHNGKDLGFLQCRAQRFISHLKCSWNYVEKNPLFVIK
jgi:hypothetical protein